MAGILSILLPVFALILIGIFVERLRLIPLDGAATLNMFVFNLAMPCLIFSSMAVSTPTALARAGYVGGCLAGMLACYMSVHAAISRGFRRRNSEGAMLGVLAAFPNTAFMGLPILMSLFPGNHDTI